MRKNLILLGTVASLYTAYTLEILGIKLPEIERLNLERTPGIPLLHSEPVHLLGIL